MSHLSAAKGILAALPLAGLICLGAWYLAGWRGVAGLGLIATIALTMIAWRDATATDAITPDANSPRERPRYFRPSNAPAHGEDA